MSWPDTMSPWTGDATPDPLRLVILGALAEAFVTRRAAAGFCADCRDGALCPDHAEDEAAAIAYEDAFGQVAAGSPAWCDLAVKLISEMN